MYEQIDTTIETVLPVIRPGDALFVMPVAGEHWTNSMCDQISALVKERLPEARIIVLPLAATLATIAVEDARQP